MLSVMRNWHLRELRFLGMVGVTGLIMVVYLATALRPAGVQGGGWRTIDLDALQRRIETGELRDREADWYHEATEEEAAAAARHP